MNFDICIQRCNLHPYQDIKYFHQSRKFLHTPSQSMPPSPNNHFSGSFSPQRVLPFLKLYINGIMYFVLFCVQLLLLSMCLKDYPHCCTYHQFLLIAEQSFLSRISCNHSPVDRHLGCFQVLTIAVKSTANILGMFCHICFDFSWVNRGLIAELQLGVHLIQN